MNTDRKLASIQEISSITQIEGADFIELAHILGWQCVVNKGDFKVGDKCVYFEVDSYLPIREEFEALREMSYKNSPLLGEGFIIRTRKFRGMISQGYVRGLDILPKGDYEIGDDVTSLLGVVEWCRVESQCDFGVVIKDIPNYIVKTKEARIQSMPNLIDDLTGKPYYITNKIDGTSTTVFSKDGTLGICGHHTLYKLSTYKHLKVLQPVMDAIMKDNIDNIAIQGELAGPAIEGNTAGFSKICFNIFSIQDILKGEYYTLDEMIDFVNRHNLKMVEVVERGESFDYTLDDLICKADGKYDETGRNREGIVVRSTEYRSDKTKRNESSFKVLSNKYLLKHND